MMSWRLFTTWCKSHPLADGFPLATVGAVQGRFDGYAGVFQTHLFGQRTNDAFRVTEADRTAWRLFDVPELEATTATPFAVASDHFHEAIAKPSRKWTGQSRPSQNLVFQEKFPAPGKVGRGNVPVARTGRNALYRVRADFWAARCSRGSRCS